MDYKKFFGIVALVMMIDRITKYLAFLYLEPGQSINAIEGLLNWTLTINTGAGFSIFHGNNTLLIWFSIIIIGLLLYYSVSAQKGQLIPLALILGGAMSNLIDRISVAGVIDFIDILVWPVFNIADASITIGVFLMLFALLKEAKETKKVRKDRLPENKKKKLGKKTRRKAKSEKISR